MYHESLFVHFGLFWAHSVGALHPGNYNPFCKLPALRINAAFWPSLLIQECLSLTQAFWIYVQYQLPPALPPLLIISYQALLWQHLTWFYMYICLLSLSFATDDWFKRQTEKVQQCCWQWSGKLLNELKSKKFQCFHFLKHFILAFVLNEVCSHYSGFKRPWWI